MGRLWDIIWVDRVTPDWRNYSLADTSWVLLRAYEGNTDVDWVMYYRGGEVLISRGKSKTIDEAKAAAEEEYGRWRRDHVVVAENEGERQYRKFIDILSKGGS